MPPEDQYTSTEVHSPDLSDVRNFAKSTAQHIIEKYDPNEQNEIINIIYRMIKESRDKVIADAKEKVAYLSKTMSQLIANSSENSRS